MNSKTPLRKTARSPKCSRCRNHGFTVELKGHAGKCPFLACTCWKCSLITERTKIMARQRRIRRTISTESAAPTAAVPTGSEGNTYTELARRPTDPGDIARHGAVHDRGGLARAGVNDSAHIPWEFYITDVPQKSPHSSEMLAMPLPFQLCYHHPDGYVYPAFLVSLQQPPPPGTLSGEALSFPHLLPNVLAYPAEPRQPQEGPVSFYAPYPLYPSVLEECSPRPYHHPLFNKVNDNGASGSPSSPGREPEMVQASQGRDANHGQ